MAFLDDTLAKPSPLPKVVVTHHAPHPGSVPAGRDLSWCDASDLTDLIQRHNPALWAHGHIHARDDYTVGATRIVWNPRGHVEEVSAQDFDPSFVVDLATPAGSA